jgi:hypothetical protein
MRLQPDSSQRADEQRSYFPDWTPKLPELPEELEADRNSYLAGGYAEEFGYVARLGVSRGVPVLDGKLPEECPEWRGEAAAMHPGYPITPYPLALDRAQISGDVKATAQPQRAATVESQGGFVSVTDRAYEREHHRSAQRAVATITRVLATFLALRWELSRRPVRLRNTK